MRIGHRRAAAVAVLVLPLAACAPGNAAPSGGGPVVEASVPGTQAEPSADPTAHLEALLPEVHDLPTGGWRLEPSTDDTDDEFSSDQQSLGPCFLELQDVLPELEVSPTAGRQFTREATDSLLVVGVIDTDDPPGVLARVESAMAPCSGPQTGTSSGQQTTVESEPADLPGLPDDTLCRHYAMSVGYRSMSGHLCFGAVDDLLVTQMTISTYAFQEVPGDEVVGLLTTALEKARG